MEQIAIDTWTSIRHKLLNFVYRKVKDRALAEDIVHDVFLKVHSKASQLRDTEKISSWIFQITRHAVADYYRHQSRVINPLDIDWNNESDDLNDCVAFCLNALVSTLPDKYKEAIELTEHQNLSQLALAERLNISYSGAKSRVQRARLLLREKLESSYHIQTDSYGNVIECEDRAPCTCD